jgi:putative ABC transport system permease protein
MNHVIIIAFRNLLQAKRRSLLLGSALSTVTALMLVLSGFSNGISQRMIQSATTLSSGHITVGGFYKSRASGAAPLIADHIKIKEIIDREVPDAVRVVDRIRSWGRIIGPLGSINTGVSGLRTEQEQVFFDSLRFAKEWEYVKNGSEERKGNLEIFKSDPNSVIIFAAQAKRLGVQVGDKVTFVTEVDNQQSNTADLTVAAICEDFGFLSNFSIFVPRPTVVKLNNVKDTVTGAYYIYLNHIKASDSVRNRLFKAIEGSGYAMMDYDPNPFFMKFPKVQTADWLGQKIDLTIWNEEISFLQWVTAALDAISYFLLALLGFIIATGIANSLSMSVRERTKEIGTVRAIGMQRSQVAWMFLGEAGFLGLISTSLGSLLGIIAIWGLNGLQIQLPWTISTFLMTKQLYFEVGFKDVVVAILAFTFITSVAALPPALRASKLQPVEAMRKK